jgi:uncharacterized protein YcfJ
MSKSCIKLALCVAAFSVLSVASATEFEDFARVVSVAPQVEQVNYPQQECRTEYVQVQRQQQRGVGGAILGGVAGGLLGNQVGGGHGKTAATAAGAIAGALVGDRLENNGQAAAGVETQPVQQCRTVDNWQSRTNGYLVTYEYQGHRQTQVMPYDPGQKLRVQVAVTPRL